MCFVGFFSRLHFGLDVLSFLCFAAPVIEERLNGRKERGQKRTGMKERRKLGEGQSAPYAMKRRKKTGDATACNHLSSLHPSLATSPYLPPSSIASGEGEEAECCFVCLFMKAWFGLRSSRWRILT
mmetsp:Transcript_2718/g.5613  ORF Transcript_2718/g.5613 Transcript_2718/m.5613 type:complete len:126 (+) Transcript_2718:1034-1411(+)